MDATTKAGGESVSQLACPCCGAAVTARPEGAADVPPEQYGMGCDELEGIIAQCGSVSAAARLAGVPAWKLQSNRAPRAEVSLRLAYALRRGIAAGQHLNADGEPVLSKRPGPRPSVSSMTAEELRALVDSCGGTAEAARQAAYSKARIYQCLGGRSPITVRLAEAVSQAAAACGGVSKKGSSAAPKAGGSR